MYKAFSSLYKTDIQVWKNLKCITYYTDRMGYWWNVVRLDEYPTGAGYRLNDLKKVMVERGIPLKEIKTLFGGIE